MTWEHQIISINIVAPLDKVWLLACAVSRGYGAALNAAKITKDSKVGIWGLGAVGLSVAMGAKERGAKTIIGIDINESKFQRAKEFGCTECVNPNTLPKPIVQHLAEKTNGGLDFTFECIGNVHTMVSTAHHCGSHAHCKFEGGSGVEPHGLGRVRHPWRGAYRQVDRHAALAAHRRQDLARMRLRSIRTVISF